MYDFPSDFAILLSVDGRLSDGDRPITYKGHAAVPDTPVISIIDDDELVRAATNRLVRSVGYLALTFTSAEEFLQSPRLNDTSCVIADVQMPGMNGLELQSALLAKGNSVPMIFITAHPGRKSPGAGAGGRRDRISEQTVRWLNIDPVHRYRPGSGSGTNAEPPLAPRHAASVTSPPAYFAARHAPAAECGHPAVQQT